MHDAPPYPDTRLSRELSSLLGLPAFASTFTRAYFTWRVDDLLPERKATSKGEQVRLSVFTTTNGLIAATITGISPKPYALPGSVVAEALSSLAQALNLPPLTDNPLALALSGVLRAATGLPAFIPPSATVAAPVKVAAAPKGRARNRRTARGGAK